MNGRTKDPKKDLREIERSKDPAPKRRLFGTDGVRDIANIGSMTPELAARLGRAFVAFLGAKGRHAPRIAVCRDTRRSGPMIESALTSGMLSAGADVYTLGVFPTPGASFMLRHGDLDAGAVISASHNPAEYNGIKFFDDKGCKLTDADEARIEALLELEGDRPVGADVGFFHDAMSLRGSYVDWLRDQVANLPDTSWPIVVDAANGAASPIVRDVFSRWKGSVHFLGANPDGLNINDGVGVISMDAMRSETVRVGARLGIAYDGDADRVLLCDSKGRVIDGDIIMWVVGRYLASRGELGPGLVATVMSNIALEERLSADGIELFRCPVGDRYVLEKMRETGARLGGEQSGHVIAGDYVGTGDGLCTGLFFITACAALDDDIETIYDRFPRCPQVLRNVRTKDSDIIMSSPILAQAQAAAEQKLAGTGRILLRPSGTEPLLRILVEARDESLMYEVCGDLERAVNEAARRI